MDEVRNPRDSAELLEFGEKRRIPRFSRNRGKPTEPETSNAFVYDHNNVHNGDERLPAVLSLESTYS